MFLDSGHDRRAIAPMRGCRQGKGFDAFLKFTGFDVALESIPGCLLNFRRHNCWVSMRMPLA